MSPPVVVVMALHQGRAYLDEQVSSIVGQTRPPDLVLLRDDQSTDGSGELAAQLLRAAGVAVDLRRNEARLGAAATFEVALTEARREGADVVVLCDQDDVWRPDRLATVTRWLDDHPDADLVFCDGRIVDGSSTPQRGTLWEHAGFTGALRAQWEGGDPLGVLLRHNVVTGATTAVRARLLDRALPLPPGAWHDAWLALVAVTSSVALALPEPLVDYRLHGGNAVGLQRPGTATQVRASAGRGTADRSRLLRRDLALFERLDEHLARQPVGGDAHDRVRAKRALLEARLHLPRRLPARAAAVARAWRAGDYARYAVGTPSAVNDLVRPLRDDG